MFSFISLLNFLLICQSNCDIMRVYKSCLIAVYGTFEDTLPFVDNGKKVRPLECVTDKTRDKTSKQIRVSQIINNSNDRETTEPMNKQLQSTKKHFSKDKQSYGKAKKNCSKRKENYIQKKLCDIVDNQTVNNLLIDNQKNGTEIDDLPNVTIEVAGSSLPPPSPALNALAAEPSSTDYREEINPNSSTSIDAPDPIQVVIDDMIRESKRRVDQLETRIFEREKIEIANIRERGKIEILNEKRRIAKIIHESVRMLMD